MGLLLYALGIPAGIMTMLVKARQNHLETLLEVKRQARQKHIELVHQAVSKRNIVAELSSGSKEDRGAHAQQGKTAHRAPLLGHRRSS